MRKTHCEKTLRKHLKDMDLFLEKSRARNWSIYNQLGYRIMDYRIGCAICQSGDYSWTLEDVDEFVFGTDEEE